MTAPKIVAPAPVVPVKKTVNVIPAKSTNLLSSGPVKPVVKASSPYKSSYHNKYDNDDYDDYDDYFEEDYHKPAFDPKKNPLYKTSMCKNMVMTGHCSYEHTCLYAHSKKELKKAPEFMTTNNFYNQHEPLDYEEDL